MIGGAVAPQHQWRAAPGYKATLLSRFF